MPPKDLSRWDRFKNWVTGMTAEERELDFIDQKIWELEKILEWNEEIGRRYFNESSLRGDLATLKKEATALRRQLPADSVFKLGPRMDRYYRMNPYIEVEAHAQYLRRLLVERRMDLKFPLVETEMRLRMLEERLRLMSSAGGFQYQPYRGYYWSSPPQQPNWNVSVGPVAPAVPGGYGPPSPNGGYVPVAPAVPINGFGPPSPGFIPDQPQVQVRGPFGRAGLRARDPRTGRFVSRTQRPPDGGMRTRR